MDFSWIYGFKNEKKPDKIGLFSYNGGDNWK
jgi:hypothetical protein